MIITDPHVVGLLRVGLDAEQVRALRLVCRATYAAVNATVTRACRGGQTRGDGGARRNRLRPFLDCAKKFKNLQMLDISGRPLTAAEVRALARVAHRWPHLLGLNAADSQSCGNRFYEAQSRIDTLSDLCALAAKHWPRLQQLVLGGCGVVDLPAYGALNNLRVLKVGGRAPIAPDLLLTSMPAMPTLLALDVTDVACPPGMPGKRVADFVASLDAKFPSLQRLIFRDCATLFTCNSARVVEALAGLQLPHVTEVSLSRSLPLDTGSNGGYGRRLARAAWLARVQVLQLDGLCTASTGPLPRVYVPSYCGRGLRQFLLHAAAPKLRYLNLQRSSHDEQTTGDAFDVALHAFVARAPLLRHLLLDSCDGLARPGAQDLPGAFPLPSLQHLSVAFPTYRGEVAAWAEALLDLLWRFDCPALHTLNMAGVPLKSVGQLLPRFAHVRDLRLHHSHLNLVGLRRIAEFRALEALDIRFARGVHPLDMPFAEHYLGIVLPSCRVRS